jgi:hypothetical protein
VFAGFWVAQHPEAPAYLPWATAIALYSFAALLVFMHRRYCKCEQAKWSA